MIKSKLDIETRTIWFPLLPSFRLLLTRTPSSYNPRGNQRGGTQRGGPQRGGRGGGQQQRGGNQQRGRGGPPRASHAPGHMGRGGRAGGFTSVAVTIGDTKSKSFLEEWADL
ncbi:hypothetical protein FOBRF1_003380 [Fusarium oxysporum]